MNSRRRTPDRLRSPRSEIPFDAEYATARPQRPGAGVATRTSFRGAARSRPVRCRRYVIDPRSGLLSWF